MDETPWVQLNSKSRFREAGEFQISGEISSKFWEEFRLDEFPADSVRTGVNN